MKKIVWMACGMALMCAPLSASANVRYDDPQEKVQKKEVPNPEKAAQRRTDEKEQYATWQTVKPQPQVLPPMPEGERPGLGPRGPEEEEAPLLDTAAE